MQSFSTTHNPLFERAVCMKTQEELYQKVRLIPRLPRVVLKPNSHSGQQDLRCQDARPSWDPWSESKSYEEIWNNAVDYRIPGIPLSTFEQQNTNRKDKVKNLIENFENHQHKESFLQDLSQTQKINKFSKESQDLIIDMNNTEIFELCKNSSKQQCPECNAYWRKGISILQSWRMLKIFAETKRVRQEQQRRVLNSWLSYKKIAVAVPNTDLLNDKRCTTKLKKTHQEKHGGYSSILERWNNDYHYRKLLSDIGWTKEHIMHHDRIVLEKHSHVATRAERIQNSKHRILTLNKEGAQQPLNQRAPGKDPTRIQRYSSQWKSKTAKRTSVRGTRRIRLCSRPSNRLDDP